MPQPQLAATRRHRDGTVQSATRQLRVMCTTQPALRVSHSCSPVPGWILDAGTRRTGCRSWLSPPPEGSSPLPLPLIADASNLRPRVPRHAGPGAASQCASAVPLAFSVSYAGPCVPLVFAVLQRACWCGTKRSKAAWTPARLQTTLHTIDLYHIRDVHRKVDDVQPRRLFCETAINP